MSSLAAMLGALILGVNLHLDPGATFGMVLLAYGLAPYDRGSR